MALTLEDRYRGALLGLACGDAVGTTVEFRPRGTFTPVTDMIGGGPFRLAPGQWTDDTSMALCLAESLLERGGFDARDQMERYTRWWKSGYWSSTGECFDIGTTVRAALRKYRDTGEPVAGSADPTSAGNGSLMRLAPVVLFYYPRLAQILEFSAASSRTTHGAPEAIDCCLLLAECLTRALSGAPKRDVLAAAESSVREAAVQRLANGHSLEKSVEDIAGTGYAVASLEAALWCFHRSASCEEAILMATNLGDDADTTAAIVGQLAGAHYGIDGIPPRWLARLHQRDAIDALAKRLYAVSWIGQGCSA